MGDPQRRDEMAGSQADRPRRAGHVAGLAVMSLVLGTMARAQVPGPLSPAPPGDARAQNPLPPLSMAGMPAAKFAEIVDTVDPLGAPYGPTTVPRPGCNAGPDAAPTRVEVGSSTRSPSRSSASPTRIPGGRCRSRSSSARAGTRP